ncbi:uncharacterized protein ACHE_11164A [Aspergillus chevalieri]|uniref:Uncharacterized protein n=1 Tax=Aspergillus chevalieri TaxID=182096 RepID=A0A7R7ZK62_ASPCH|nr:uncharacterized protein ACHE_11164A [Aspergillus chevalieri]BCR83762.1 hypothetical protein ACHE_11164A [Aspergillus chevalieri]
MATMSAGTTTYNVYRVFFSQSSSIDHEAIALVPAENKDQGAGRFYHVTGTVGLGMDYDSKPAYRFDKISEYKGAAFLFRLPRAQLARFEDIARSCPPPHDVRALMEANPNPPVRNCVNWIDEVLAGARKLV